MVTCDSYQGTVSKTKCVIWIQANSHQAHFTCSVYASGWLPYQTVQLRLCHWTGSPLRWGNWLWPWLGLESQELSGLMGNFCRVGGEEMAQWLRVLGLVSGPTWRLTTICNSNFRESHTIGLDFSKPSLIGVLKCFNLLFSPLPTRGNRKERLLGQKRKWICLEVVLWDDSSLHCQYISSSVHMNHQW